MKIIGTIRLFGTLALLTCVGYAAPEDGVKITRASGGSIRTSLSSSIVLNSGSSLNREWISITHTALPVSLVGTPGITTKYEVGGRYSNGEYQYVAKFSINVTEPITAIEIRFLTFDIWGERGKSLVSTEVEDYAVGQHELTGTWHIYGENEASEYYASIAYIAKVRTKDGRVLTADVRPVVEEARKFYSKFAEADLDPVKPAQTK